MSAGSDGADFAKLRQGITRSAAGAVERSTPTPACCKTSDEAAPCSNIPRWPSLPKKSSPPEKPNLHARRPFQLALLPARRSRKKPAMLKFAPEQGADEAALFAADLLRMYQRVSERRLESRMHRTSQYYRTCGVERKSWPIIKGENVFARLKYEFPAWHSGLQRVPSTEKCGAHSYLCRDCRCACKKAETPIIHHWCNDLRIDTMRRRQARAGKHVNTTDSAVD